MRTYAIDAEAAFSNGHAILAVLHALLWNAYRDAAPIAKESGEEVCRLPFLRYGDAYSPEHWMWEMDGAGRAWEDALHVCCARADENGMLSGGIPKDMPYAQDPDFPVLCGTGGYYAYQSDLVYFADAESIETVSGWRSWDIAEEMRRIALSEGLEMSFPEGGIMVVPDAGF